tara:strand:- start:306 stop:1172 length:867 start_codon:yes stop_codon:yes gene_type:complete
MSTVYYVRISSLSQNNFNPSSSAETQEFNIKKFMSENNFKCHKEGKFSEVASAKNDDKRLIFKQMIEKLFTDKCFKDVKFIVVNDVSRFHRNIHLGLNVLEKLATKGITVISINDNCKYGPPPITLSEKIKFRNKLIEAENEWLKISERSQNTIKYRKERGDFFGRPPFGFSTKRDSDGTIKLVENKKEKEILDQIYDMYEKNVSYKQISFFLNQKNKLNRGKEWSSKSISYYIGRNPTVYKNFISEDTSKAKMPKYKKRKISHQSDQTESFIDVNKPILKRKRKKRF